MTNSSQRISNTINLGALVLISSFLQHNKVIQYVLLAASLLFYLDHRTGGFVALGILILESLVILLGKLLPSGKSE